MSYQFIHIDSYSRTASQQKGMTKKKYSVRDILNEATREPNACRHVEQPQPPNIIFGKVADVETAVDDYLDNTQDPKGRKLRKDALALVAGVFSCADEDLKKWPEIKKRTLQYLKDKYGERLKCVIEHNDEAHKHCHFYVVPKPGERFDDIHDGKRAMAQAKADGELKGAQNKAYCDGMREFQRDYFLKVSSKAGLTQMGPKRRRLTRAEWKAEKNNANNLAITYEKQSRRNRIIERKKRSAERVIKTADELPKYVKATGKLFRDILNTVQAEQKKGYEDTIKSQGNQIIALAGRKEFYKNRDAEKDRALAKANAEKQALKQEMESQRRYYENRLDEHKIKNEISQRKTTSVPVAPARKSGI